MHRSVWPVVIPLVALIGLAEAARAQEPARATKEDISLWYGAVTWGAGWHICWYRPMT
jgi:hypothetical protein